MQRAQLRTDRARPIKPRPKSARGGRQTKVDFDTNDLMTAETSEITFSAGTDRPAITYENVVSGMSMKDANHKMPEQGTGLHLSFSLGASVIKRDSVLIEESDIDSVDDEDDHEMDDSGFEMTGDEIDSADNGSDSDDFEIDGGALGQYLKKKNRLKDKTERLHPSISTQVSPHALST